MTGLKLVGETIAGMSIAGSSFDVEAEAADERGGALHVDWDAVVHVGAGAENHQAPIWGWGAWRRPGSRGPSVTSLQGNQGDPRVLLTGQST